MTPKEKKYLVAALLIGVAVYAWSQNLLAPYGVPFTTVPKTTTTSTTSPAPTGIFNLVATSQDNFSPSTITYACATDYSVGWYALRQGTWVLLGTCGSVATPTQVQLTAQDGGYLYAAVSTLTGCNSSTLCYPVPSKTSTLQPQVVGTSWQSPPANGVNQFVFKYSMFGIPAPATGYPQTTFTAYLATYGGASSGYSLNAPAAITGIGTASANKFISWYATFTTVNRAVTFTQIDLTFNITDTTKVNLVNMNVPGVGLVSGSAFQLSVLGGSITTSSDNMRFRWQVNTDPNEIPTQSTPDIRDLESAIFALYGLNQLNQFAYTTQLTMNLASGDKINCKLTVYMLTPSLTLTTTGLVNSVGLAA